MVIREDGNMENKSSHKESSFNSEIDSPSDSSHDEGDLLMGKLCFIIIDGGGYVNVASLRLVEKLNLLTIVYPNLINCSGQTSVIGFYLGEYDRKVIHDGVTNRFSFVYMEQKVTLKPFSLREVSEDQLKMKIKKEKEQKNIEKKRRSRGSKEKKKRKTK
ncbi:hypothetical protein CR513_56620, partial [Mucuna pruriens]